MILPSKIEWKGELHMKKNKCKSTLIKRTYECVGCGQEFEQKIKGRDRKTCQGCQKLIKEEKVIRNYTCVKCNKNFMQSGRGRLRVRCKSCVPRKHKIEPSGDTNLLDLIIGGYFE